MERLSIRTPARLHFGLLEINKDQPYRFGGLGLMINSPSFHIEVRASSSFDASRTGSWRSRVEATAHHWAFCRNQSTLPSVAIQIVEAIPPHHGLGSGTQLACAISRLLDDCMIADRIPKELKEPIRFQESLQDLKRIARRGERSQIGLAGFLAGGFIFDRGSSSDRSDVEKLDSPETWRVLLVHPFERECVSGEQEAKFFIQCESRPNPNRNRMLQLIEGTILPAWKQGELSRMSEAIYEYGTLSGDIFRTVQHGSFRTKEIADRVARLRGIGVRAVGQSSWGPTVFGIVEDAMTAKQVVESWKESPMGCEISIATISQHGAVANSAPDETDPA